MTDEQKNTFREEGPDTGNDAAGQREDNPHAWSGEEAKKRLFDDMKRVGAVVWKHLRKYVSVPFVVMLLLSTVLWYAKKLGHTYQTEVPITVNVAGRQFDVNCIVEGQGTRLFARQHYRAKPVELRWSDLDVSPSSLREGWVVISPYSLQNAISSRNTDIKVLSVGPIPEIEL